MMSVEYHPDALNELAEAARYYESAQIGLGERFHRLVQQAENDIAENPETGFLYDHDTRIRLIRKFPYGVVFKSNPDRIFIVAVAQLNRKPGYWKRRLNSM